MFNLLGLFVRLETNLLLIISVHAVGMKSLKMYCDDMKIEVKHVKR